MRLFVYSNQCCSSSSDYFFSRCGKLLEFKSLKKYVLEELNLLSLYTFFFIVCTDTASYILQFVGPIFLINIAF